MNEFEHVGVYVWWWWCYCCWSVFALLLFECAVGFLCFVQNKLFFFREFCFGHLLKNVEFVLDIY